MTQLLLVRHGEPLAAVAEEGSTNGADPGLSELGHAQAARVAEWFMATGEPVAEVVVSSMRRAQETVSPLAQRLGVTPTVADDLAEYDRGRHSYRPVADVAGGGPDPDWDRIREGLFPTFVDVDRFTARVLVGLADIAIRHPGRDTAVVVCHAGVINTYLADILDLDRPLVFPLDHGSVTRVLVSRDGERRVRSVNETQHVADLL